MKSSLLATCLVLLTGSAFAEPLASYAQTTGEVGLAPISEYDQGQSFPEIDLPLFNPSLGVLQSVELDVSVSADFAILNRSGTPLQTPELVPATIGLGIFGTFLNYGFPVISTSVYANGISGIVSGDFAQSFIDSEPNISGKYVNYNFFDLSISGNIPTLTAGSDASDTESGFYTLSETFFYAPSVNVPEPSSLTLLIAGMAGLGCLALRRPTGSPKFSSQTAI